jgi:hypothetical protein
MYKVILTSNLDAFKECEWLNEFPIVPRKDDTITSVCGRLTLKVTSIKFELHAKLSRPQEYEYVILVSLHLDDYWSKLPLKEFLNWWDKKKHS